MQVPSTDIRCFVYATGVRTQVRVRSDAVVADVLDAIGTQRNIDGYRPETWLAYPVDMVSEARTYKKRNEAPFDVSAPISSATFDGAVRIWVAPSEAPVVATLSTVPGTSRQVHMECLGVVQTRVMGMGVDLWE